MEAGVVKTVVSFGMTLLLLASPMANHSVEAQTFPLNAHQCFGHMPDPSRAWNGPMLSCFNQKNANSCSQALLNTRDRECRHDISLQLARINLVGGNHRSAFSYAEQAISSVDTPSAWIIFGLAAVGSDQPTQTKLANLDRAISSLTPRRGQLAEIEQRNFDAILEHRSKLIDAIRQAQHQHTLAQSAQEAELKSIQERCSKTLLIDGRPTFFLGSGAINYERAVKAFVSANSTGVVGALHDKRRRDGNFGSLLERMDAERKFMMHPYTCVYSVKYVKHITTQSSPLGKLHIAEVIVRAMDRDLRDVEHRKELSYSD